MGKSKGESKPMFESGEIKLLKILIEKVNQIMSVLTDLQTATANLNTAVVSLTTRITSLPSSGSVSDSDVENAVTAISDATNALNALVPASGPVLVPTPVSTPTVDTVVTKNPLALS